MASAKSALHERSLLRRRGSANRFANSLLRQQLLCGRRQLKDHIGLRLGYYPLRPLGIEAVKVLFAREMERELRKLLESGAVKALRGRKRRR